MGSNKWAVWANCARCGDRVWTERLRNQWAREYEIMVADLQKEKTKNDRDDETFMVMDTGCRRVVAGKSWHENRQRLCRELGLTPIRIAIKERFKFGNQKPEKSHQAWLYPVAINKTPGVLRVAEVEGERTPLLSGEALAALGTTLHLKQDTFDMEAVELYAEKMKYNEAGHPVINISDFGRLDDGIYDVFRRTSDQMMEYKDETDLRLLLEQSHRGTTRRMTILLCSSDLLTIKQQQRT